MNSAIERLLNLRAGDVMQKQIIQVSHDDTVAQAAALLVEKKVTGAPVVDEQQRCVGAISATDFMRRVGNEKATDDENSFRSDTYQLLQSLPGAPLAIDSIADDLVSAHMSASVQTVSSDTSLLTTARCMCAEHIHRVFVLDEHQRVQGVITTLDLLAAMIKAVEE